MAELDLLLGSASPRRQALLATLPVAFEVCVADVDEQIEPSHSAAHNAARLALAKFDALVRVDDSELRPDGVPILTADTLVSCNGVVLAKPTDIDDARRMLELVSGESIDIVSSVCLGREPGPRQLGVSTIVRLRALSDYEIESYLAAGVALDKAGALSLQYLATQTGAAPFIEAVDQCWSNVIGLPLCAVSALLTGSPQDREVRDLCTVDLCGHPGGETALGQR